MEDGFSCSGICNAYPYYIYSDINRGIPKGGCLDYFTEFTAKYCGITEAICATIAGLFFVAIVCVTMFFCMEKKKGKKEIMDYGVLLA